MLHLQSICRKKTLTKVDTTFTKGLCKKTQIKHLFTNFADRPSKKRGMPDGRTHTHARKGLTAHAAMTDSLTKKKKNENQHLQQERIL